jgi:hypothetical protein
MYAAQQSFAFVARGGASNLEKQLNSISQSVFWNWNRKKRWRLENTGLEGRSGSCRVGRAGNRRACCFCWFVILSVGGGRDFC